MSQGSWSHEGEPCPGGDETCPGQDGDWCHYRGPGAWPIRYRTEAQPDGSTRAVAGCAVPPIDAEVSS